MLRHEKDVMSSDIIFLRSNCYELEDTLMLKRNNQLVPCIIHRIWSDKNVSVITLIDKSTPNLAMLVLPVEELKPQLA